MTKLPSTLPIRTAPTARREGDVGDHQRGRSRVHRPDVVRLDVIDDQRNRDELRLTTPALREQRAQRPVDHACGKRRLLACAPLALEERAGDLARGVHALLDVNRQREKIYVAFVACGGSSEDDSLAHGDDDRAARPVWPACRSRWRPPYRRSRMRPNARLTYVPFVCSPLGLASPPRSLDASVVELAGHGSVARPWLHRESSYSEPRGTPAAWWPNGCGGWSLAGARRT